MSSQAARRAPSPAAQPSATSPAAQPPQASTALRSPNPLLTLRELVDRYRALAGAFGKPVPLSAFALSPGETERLFSSCDEDYHISRFFHLTEGDGDSYAINGIPATHVRIDECISVIL
jgi:hypothetical protein